MPFPDYEEFLAALNAREVRYLVIGAHALAFQARPLATKDLDIFFEPSPDNATKVLAAIRDFFGSIDFGYSVDDLISPEWIIQLGAAPVRIDLLAGIKGISDFGEAWDHRLDTYFGAVPTHIIGLDDLIQTKEATGRLQDRADDRVLRRRKAQDGSRHLHRPGGKGGNAKNDSFRREKRHRMTTTPINRGKPNGRFLENHRPQHA